VTGAARSESFWQLNSEIDSSGGASEADRLVGIRWQRDPLLPQVPAYRTKKDVTIQSSGLTPKAWDLVVPP
jgi:hypothetical protein